MSSRVLGRVVIMARSWQQIAGQSMQTLPLPDLFCFLAPLAFFPSAMKTPLFLPQDARLKGRDLCAGKQDRKSSVTIPTPMAIVKTNTQPAGVSHGTLIPMEQPTLKGSQGVVSLLWIPAFLV